MTRLDARWILVSVVVVTLIGCTGNQESKQSSVDTAAITAQIDSVNQAFAAAVAARDTDAVVALYADDARLMPAGMRRFDGRDSIRVAWGDFLKTPGLELTISGSEPIISQAGDMVVDVGRYSMKMNDAKGEQVEDIGKYVTVLKKVDGQWKIVVDTFNSDQAPPGM